MRAGRYTLKQRLGAGGMGEVWLATDDGPHGYRKTVVIKRMLPEAARFLGYFTSEAKLGARLTHQNIVQVIDFFVEGDQHNIVMEYVEGATVQELLARDALAPEEAACVAVQALKGLEFAHNATIDGSPANIVHRDLSPDNLLVSCDAEVKVTDFGIAKATVAWRAGTQEGFKGKWGYISPEALMGQDVDRRADVYAMGVVLYEMLSHRRAFPSSSSAYQLTNKIVEGLVEPLASVAPAVPRAVVQVVEAMMHRHREERTPTAGAARDALVRALPAFLESEKVLAERVRQFSAKKRRWTSPFLRDDERAGLTHGVVRSAVADQETVKFVEADAETRPGRDSPARGAEREPAAPRASLDASRTVRRIELRRRARWLETSLLVLVVGIASAAAAVLVARRVSPAPSAPSSPSLSPPAPSAPPPSPVGAPAVAPPLAPPVAPATAAKPPARAAHSRAEAEDQPGAIVVTGPVAVTVDGVSIGSAPLTYPVGPGSHDLSFTDPTTQARSTRRVRVRAGQRLLVEFP